MKKHIATLLAVAGLACFYLAHKLLQLKFITDDGYFRLYAWGLLSWAIRQRINEKSLVDKLVCNIILWLCLFNVYDEHFAANPMQPYKPYIISLIIIITCTYIYTQQCRKDRTN